VRRGEPERFKILSRDGSYHGSTSAGMSATGAEPFRSGFGPLVPGFAQVPLGSGPDPTAPACTLAAADELERAIDRHGPESVAAVVAEPVAILGAVKVPVDRYWDRGHQICRDAGALLIVDEVVTGFARTGRLFASEHWGIEPDVMTVAKGLTSGYVPMGATGVSRSVEEAFADGPLLHLNTYAGHPVACAAALAVLDVIEDERLAERAAELEAPLTVGLDAIRSVTGRVRRVSCIGLLSSIELDVSDRGNGQAILTRLRHELYERGLIARCSVAGGVLTVVFYPTLIVSANEIALGTKIIGEALLAALGEQS
jgi:adenosylmethionine-8-amino-7-oxononanoate aminotransferase